MSIVQLRPLNLDFMKPRRDVAWFIGVRLILLGLCLLAAISCLSGYSCSVKSASDQIFAILAGFFLFSAGSAWWLRAYRPGSLYVLIQFIIDASICSWIIYLTGGPGSPLLFLYPLLVMAVSICVSRFAGLGFSLFCLFSHAALTLSMVYGWIPAADGAALAYRPAGGLILQLIGLGSAMVLIAVMTGYLVDLAESGQQLAEKSRKDLSELSLHHKRLFDELPEGVITTDLVGAVTSANPSANRVFGKGKEGLVGLDLREIFKRDLDIDQDYSLSELLRWRDVEFALRSNSEFKLKITVKPSLSTSGETVGWICLLQDVSNLRAAEDEIALHRQMVEMLDQSESVETSRTGLAGLSGTSLIMQKVFNLIERVAPSEATVLISGESGTGKELVARAIHQGSNRSLRPFVAVNCGAIPESLMESQLFGHKRGSFTGADSDHTGLFRQAEGGTLFLDEIGELPLLMQTKLLRAIQERKVRPVGEDRDFAIDVRIVAATNRNLRVEVEQKRFRDDLFYRLNVISISLPSLRDRREDIPSLVNDILGKLTGSGQRPLVPAHTMKLLLQYSYPGNVRELENILERALVLGGQVILPEHLPESVRGSREDIDGLEVLTVRETEIIVREDLSLPIDLDSLLRDVEKKYLLRALQTTNGAKKKAAGLLGVNFRSFRYRCQKLGLDTDTSVE